MRLLLLFVVCSLAERVYQDENDALEDPCLERGLSFSHRVYPAAVASVRFTEPDVNYAGYPLTVGGLLRPVYEGYRAFIRFSPSVLDEIHAVDNHAFLIVTPRFVGSQFDGPDQVIGSCYACGDAHDGDAHRLRLHQADATPIAEVRPDNPEHPWHWEPLNITWSNMPPLGRHVGSFTPIKDMPFNLSLTESLHRDQALHTTSWLDFRIASDTLWSGEFYNETVPYKAGQLFEGTGKVVFESERDVFLHVCSLSTLQSTSANVLTSGTPTSIALLVVGVSALLVLVAFTARRVCHRRPTQPPL